MLRTRYGRAVPGRASSWSPPLVLAAVEILLPLTWVVPSMPCSSAATREADSLGSACSSPSSSSTRPRVTSTRPPKRALSSPAEPGPSLSSPTGRARRCAHAVVVGTHRDLLAASPLYRDLLGYWRSGDSPSASHPVGRRPVTPIASLSATGSACLMPRSRSASRSVAMNDLASRASRRTLHLSGEYGGLTP